MVLLLGDGSITYPAVGTPALVAPVNGLNNVLVALGLVLQTTTAVIAKGTHVSTDYEIRTGPNGTGTVRWSAYGSLSLLSLSVPALSLLGGQTYYLRIRHRTATDASDWSADIVITTLL